MSVIPFTTQLGIQPSDTQSSQAIIKMVLVYCDKMTDRQASLMKDAQDFLCQNLSVMIRQANELESLPTRMKYFVIPQPRDELIRRIRSRFEKPVIYLPRAVIEARGYYRVNLPVRNLAISLTMHSCKIFLVKSCDQPSIRNKISEMCGTIVSSFNNGPTVVVSDRADDRYCSKAIKSKVPLVSKDWVDQNYNRAVEEEASFFNHNASTTYDEYSIKPFYGLFFKITIKDPGAAVKKLITDNQGRIIYGNENSLTHVVCSTEMAMNDVLETSEITKKDPNRPRFVDVNFLNLCIKSGYHLTRKDYREHTRTSQPPVVKIENLTQAPYMPDSKSIAFSDRIENHTPPPIPNCSSSNKSDFGSTSMMAPPPPCSRPLRQQQPSQTQLQQNDNMNDMILKALSAFETTQTQLASTQMRRLPDQELKIEQTFEPSQQLYWNDSASRRG